MKLRFQVDQAEAFRQGVDVPKSIVTVEVNPADLPQEERDLLADRMDGIDIYPLNLGEDWIPGPSGGTVVKKTGIPKRGSSQILAGLPTYDALIKAVCENQAELENEIKEFRKKANKKA